MQVIKILIADDQALMRDGLKCLMETSDEYQVVGEIGGGDECIKTVLEVEADLLIVDSFMLGKGGVDLLKGLNEVRQENVQIKILVLTGCKEIHYLVKAIQYGIDGYVLKYSGYSELKKAIYRVMRGERYIQPDMMAELDEKKNKIEDEIDKMMSLTKREVEILRYLSVGMYNKEIALKLEISERTVKNHVSNIFKKIGVADRTQAAVFAIRNYLVEV